jgi:hypothetical protein
MKINLLKDNDDLEIKKIEFVCDNGLHEKLNKYEYTKSCNTHRFYYIVAPPASGKSNFTQNMFKNPKIFKKVFNHIYYFSPSSSSLKDDIFNKLPEYKRFTELNQENLDYVLNSTSVLDKDEKTMIVFDDVITAFKKDKDLLSNFQKMILNRRHIGGGISLMVISQVYNLLPLQLRKAVTHLIILNPRMKEFNLMNEEYFNLDNKNIKKIKEYFFDKKYNFLTYLPDENVYFKNFDKVIIDEDDDDDSNL